jgi:hypothetical protein
MQKLTLTLDNLQVETFNVDAGRDRARGTVLGAERPEPVYDDPSNLAYYCGGGGTGSGDPQNCQTAYTYCSTCPMEMTCGSSCGCSGSPTCGICT